MRGKEMMERMAVVSSMTGEPIMKQPLVELCGGNRILIEHHMGIGVYSSEEVQVKVRFGEVYIDGSNLRICKMTADQLVIAGIIDAVRISRRRST